MSVRADDVRAFVLHRHESFLRAQGLDPQSVPDDFDLRENGVIDSFGVLELISALEERFEMSIDFEDIEPESMTALGPLSRYVERKSGDASGEDAV